MQHRPGRHLPPDSAPSATFMKHDAGGRQAFSSPFPYNRRVDRARSLALLVVAPAKTLTPCRAVPLGPAEVEVR